MSPRAQSQSAWRNICLAGPRPPLLDSVIQRSPGHPAPVDQQNIFSIQSNPIPRCCCCQHRCGYCACHWHCHHDYHYYHLVLVVAVDSLGGGQSREYADCNSRNDRWSSSKGMAMELVMVQAEVTRTLTLTLDLDRRQLVSQSIDVAGDQSHHHHHHEHASLRRSPGVGRSCDNVAILLSLMNK